MSYDLKVQRVLDAGVHEVFEAVTSAEAQRIWFQGPEPDPNAVVEIECDPRVGGKWVQVWGPSRTELYRETCVFTVVDPPRRLSLTSHMSTPDGQEMDTEVDFLFEDLGDSKTRLTITHSGIDTEQTRDFLANMAWQGFFDRVEWYVTRETA
jgi:uncharacterized protein YndB with AHSA1/START domain